MKLVEYFLCILFLRDLYLPFFGPPTPSISSAPSFSSAASLNSSSSTSSTFYYVICSLSCIVLKNNLHLSSYSLTSSLSINIKCLNNSSLFLSTLVATGNIKHNETKREQEAMIKRYKRVLSTLTEMFLLSSKIAEVELWIESRILFRELVKTKKTAVSFLVICDKFISLMDSAWTLTDMTADQMFT